MGEEASKSIQDVALKTEIKRALDCFDKSLKGNCNGKLS